MRSFGNHWGVRSVGSGQIAEAKALNREGREGTRKGHEERPIEIRATPKNSNRPVQRLKGTTENAGDFDWILTARVKVAPFQSRSAASPASDSPTERMLHIG